MVLRLHELEPSVNFEVVCTPVGNEFDEVEDHINHVSSLIGKPIRRLRLFPDGDGLEQLIIKYKTIPNFRARFCTRMLKIEPMQEFLVQSAPCRHYVGLRADEPIRKGMYDDMNGVNHSYPLRDWGWKIEDVRDYLHRRGVTVPRRTDCEWCFFQRLGDWRRLHRKHPDSFKRAAELEQEVGYTFRSDRRDTWPAPLVQLAMEFESGRRVPGHSYHRQDSLFQEEYATCDMDEAGCRVCSM